MEILNDLVVPVKVAGAKLKTSAYLTADQNAVLNGLTDGQAVIFPFIAGVTAAYQAMTTKHRIAMVRGLQKNADSGFVVFSLENRGIAVKRISGNPVPAPEQGAENAPEQTEQPAEQNAE